MPYDPTPLGRRGSLTVQVEGTRDEPECLLELSRPLGGVVQIRETAGGLAPRAYEERVEVLRDRLERAHHARRRLSVDMYLVREWLDGRG